MKKALLIAYHFPPVKVSSGLQRTLSFVRDLGHHGWQTMVLTANPRAYQATSQDQVKDIPEDVEVVRAFSLDAAKHFAVAGRYPFFLALPDRWISWWLGGVFSGLFMIRRSKPDVIWSTYPIATAHLIGLTLHKITGIPWVADFRDSMTEEHYPTNPSQRRIFLWIEQKTINSCTKAVFTTPGAVEMYRARYPDVSQDKWTLIKNGYDEAIFKEIEGEIPTEQQRKNSSRLVLVHSGVVYPADRDPKPFFKAIADLKNRGLLSSDVLKVVMRATGHDALFAPMLTKLNIDDIVSLAPTLDYRCALTEMHKADGLLILQSSGCNHQIPAKVYEYFRSGRPILALTDSNGDTAKTLMKAGIDYIAPLDDPDEISNKLLVFLEDIQSGNAKSATSAAIESSSRAASAAILAETLDSI